MLFWWSAREARAVYDVVRERWSQELRMVDAADAREDYEAAARSRRRSDTFGRVMQRLERRLIRKGVLP